MKIVAVCAFFDEPDHLLEDMAASLHGFADHLIAVDGRYASFPHRETRSPQSNWEAIWRGAARAGIPADIHDCTFGRPWDGPHGGECAKRTHLFRLAERRTSERDWVFCIDADEAIVQTRDARDMLAETDLDVGTVLLVENGIDNAAAIPQLFRAIRGITVGPAHYQYTTPDGRRLWCCHNETVPQVETHRKLVLDHRTAERSEQRELERWAYYLRRDTQQVEVPEFDPETAARLGIPDTTPGVIGVDALAAGPRVALGHS